MTHLTKGLQDPAFLLEFEATTDPWERSKLVGQKISALSKSYRAMTDEQFVIAIPKTNEKAEQLYKIHK